LARPPGLARTEPRSTGSGGPARQRSTSTSRSSLMRPDHLDRPIHFLAAAADEVIGYAGLTAGDEAEACGIGAPLLAASRHRHRAARGASRRGREPGAESIRSSARTRHRSRSPGCSASAHDSIRERRMVAPLGATGGVAHRDGFSPGGPPRHRDRSQHVVAIIGEDFSDYPANNDSAVSMPASSSAPCG